MPRLRPSGRVSPLHAALVEISAALVVRERPVVASSCEIADVVSLTSAATTAVLRVDGRGPSRENGSLLPSVTRGRLLITTKNAMAAT